MMIDKFVKQFLKAFEGKKLVIGFSGGPDSMALYRAASRSGAHVILAHIDHGWRHESYDEALSLESFAQQEGVEFYLKRCQKEDFHGNLEEAARRIRLSFFKEIVEKTNSSAVLLGHHAGDQAETVLKKVLEGSPLFSLESMKPEVIISDLTLLRPLLNFTKDEILSYLGDSFYIEDKSNNTCQFLRGRMRQEMLPFLSEKLGKNILSSLCSLSNEAAELNHYIKSELERFVLTQGVFGSFIDLRKTEHSFILRAFFHSIYKQFSLRVVKSEIESLVEAIKLKKSNFIKVIKNKKLIVDRGYLFILDQIKITPENWILSYEEIDESNFGWKAAFQGKVATMASNSLHNIEFEKKTYSKWWTAHKVPSFMRDLVPVLRMNETSVAEFLSGRAMKSKEGDRKVVITFRP